jgi:hypothetical protein
VADFSASLQLHDVRDVEKLACSVIARRGARIKAKMTAEHDERLVTFLVEEAWRYASEKFDPSCPDCRDGGRASCARCKGSGLGASFSKLAFEHMARRMIDWARSEFGDSRYPNRPVVESIDIADGYHDAEGEVVKFRDTPEPLRTHDDLTVTLAGILDGVDELSPRAQWVMLEIAAPLADHYTTREDLAKLNGVSAAALDDCLDELAGELRIAA